jgi:Spy/CpxP family protein refolding chaperone
VRATILTAICITLIAVAAGGQARARPGMSAERVEMLKLWRIIDELEIEEKQAAQLFPYWSKNQRDKRSLGDERRQATHTLHQLLQSEDTDDGELEKQIGMIRVIDQRVFELNMAFRDGLKKHLDARQRARLMVFEERFRGDLRDMVRGFRRMRPDGDGTRSGGGWGGDGE